MGLGDIHPISLPAIERSRTFLRTTPSLVGGRLLDGAHRATTEMSQYGGGSCPTSEPHFDLSPGFLRCGLSAAGDWHPVLSSYTTQNREVVAVSNTLRRFLPTSFAATVFSGLVAAGSVVLAAEAGFIGPGERSSTTVGGPPLNPAAWHKVEGDVLPLDQVWGRRVKPRGIFRIPGGVGLLYNSKPPVGYTGGATHQTGSLAFSRNLIDWQDYPDNPVLHEVQEWQGNARAMPRAMLYDAKNEQWVVYFCDAGGDYPGIRAVGTAFSNDLVNWKYAPGPTLTIDDFTAAVPEQIEVTEEDLQSEGRIYASWAIYHHDRYYMQVSGTTRTGEGRTYSSIMLAADEPDGPFQLADGFRGDFVPGTRPVLWKGKWYTAYAGHWDGEPGLGIAYANSLLGPYGTNPHDPIVTLETISRARPQLFRYDGVWAILYCHQHNTDNMPMRLVIANLHPDLLNE